MGAESSATDHRHSCPHHALRHDEAFRDGVDEKGAQGLCRRGALLRRSHGVSRIFGFTWRGAGRAHQLRRADNYRLYSRGERLEREVLQRCSRPAHRLRRRSSGNGFRFWRGSGPPCETRHSRHQDAPFAPGALAE